jgi:hypothetical protein
MGVRMFDSLRAAGHVVEAGEDLVLTDPGRSFAAKLGIDTAAFARSRRPVCKSCLDWSARRSHLAGALGTALLDRFYETGWARREKGTRIVRFTLRGEADFSACFPDMN